MDEADVSAVREPVSTERRGASAAGFGATLAAAAAVYFLLSAIPRGITTFLPYPTVAELALEQPLYRLVWFIEDFTNVFFYASVFSGLGLVAGAALAWRLSERGSSRAGFVVAFERGVWPWVFAAQVLGIAISNVLYLPLLAGPMSQYGWVPTFIPFIAAPTVVLVFGTGWRSVLVGAILAGVLSTPFAVLAIVYVFGPLGILVAGVTLAIAVASIITLEVCRYLPFMRYPLPEPIGEQPTDPPHPTAHTPSWFMRRVLADFSEAPYYGNEWASGLLLLGLLVDWVIDPRQPYYGTELLPIMVAAAIVSSAVGVFLYHRFWSANGFYPTFAPVVTVVPGICLMVQGDPTLTLLAAVLGGVLTPPVADMINRSIPRHWHPVIGITLSMTLCTVVIAAVIKALPVGIGFGS